jgi:hypothetical protein
MPPPAIGSDARTPLRANRRAYHHTVQSPCQASILSYPLRIDVIICISPVLPHDNRPMLAIRSHIGSVLKRIGGTYRNPVLSPEQVSISVDPLSIDIRLSISILAGIVNPRYYRPAAAIGDNNRIFLLAQSDGYLNAPLRPLTMGRANTHDDHEPSKSNGESISSSQCYITSF